MTSQRRGGVSRRGFLLGASAWAGAIAGAASSHAAAKPPAREKVEALLRKHRVPAVSVAAFERDRIVVQEAYGQRQAGGGAAQPDTRFQAASLSKTANALCVLSLVRDGKVRLDDPVNRHLFGWQLKGKAADDVTVRMLLSHTAGTTVSGFAGYQRDAYVPTLPLILNGVAPANSAPVIVDSPPGRKFRYSGGGITVLQKMVSDIEAADYEEIVARRVFGPLGMSDSSMKQPLRPTDSLAFGHADTGETVYLDYHIYPELAAAGLWTTPADIARMLMAVVGSAAGKDGFLPKALARQMMTPVKGGAGLGVFVDGRGMINHSGVNWGFRAVYVADPRARRGAVVMSNGENGEKLNAQLLRQLG